MSPFPRRLSESETDEDDLVSEVDARENGERAFRHWRDRNEPPATIEALAMRQACPYALRDGLTDWFVLGWKIASGTAFDRVHLGRPCCVLRTFPPRRADVVYSNLERATIQTGHLRRRA